MISMHSGAAVPPDTDNTKTLMLRGLEMLQTGLIDVLIKLSFAE